jgi:hypothetical protein
VRAVLAAASCCVLLAGAMHDLNRDHGVLHTQPRLGLAQADHRAGASICHDCGARRASPPGSPAALCGLCYANRLIHGYGRWTPTVARDHADDRT